MRDRRSTTHRARMQDWIPLDPHLALCRVRCFAALETKEGRRPVQ